MKSVLNDDPERKQAYDDDHLISDAAFENWKANRAALSPYKPRQWPRGGYGSVVAGVEFEVWYSCVVSLRVWCGPCGVVWVGLVLVVCT